MYNAMYCTYNLPTYYLNSTYGATGWTWDPNHARKIFSDADQTLSPGLGFSNNVWVWYMQSGTVWIPLLREIYMTLQVAPSDYTYGDLPYYTCHVCTYNNSDVKQFSQIQFLTTHFLHISISAFASGMEYAITIVLFALSRYSLCT